MKLSKLILLVVFVLTTICGFTQGNFKKAYIVKNNNDTIHGVVDYTNPEDISLNCFFRKDSTSQILDYNPSDLKSFCFDKGKKFISKEVKYHDDTTNLFLEYLLKGIVNLYYCKVNGEDVFYIEKDSILMQLSNDEEKIEINNKVYLRNIHKYIGMLKMLLSDVESFSDKIDNTDFDFMSLIKLLKQYHNQVCSNESCIVYYKKESKLNDVKWKVNFGLSMEYTFTRINSSSKITKELKFFSYEQNPTLSYISEFEVYQTNETNTNFSTTYNCLFPVFFINLSRNSSSSFQLEANYKHLKYSLLDFSEIEIPVIYNYEFMHYKKVKPFINAGISNVITFGSKVKDMYFKYNRLEGATFENNNIKPIYSSQTDYINRLVQEMNGYHFNLNAGCGVKYELSKKNALKLELRGQTPIYFGFKGVLDGGPSYESILSSSNFSILFSYIFK